MLLIDSPIGPYHPPADIRAWIGKLREIRARHREEPDRLEQIDWHVDMAEERLARAEGL